ncbi:hypothetical protein RhiirA4_471893, partial [Rhizophagus irregularis]
TTSQNELDIKSASLNEVDLKSISLNTKLNFKDAGLDTNWTLRMPAWTIRRKFSKEAAVSSESLNAWAQWCQFLRLWNLGLVSVLLALGLGYADVASSSFGDATQLVKENLQQ